MIRVGLILLVIVAILALPFIARKSLEAGAWQPGDPVITVVTPHNEAIRYEFERGFSKWHQAKYGKPVKIDWRNIGGTTEISRYLSSEYAAAVRAWWTQQGKAWPAGASEAVISPTPPAAPDQIPADIQSRGEAAIADWQKLQVSLREVWTAYRQTDDASQFTSKVDLFFGGGEFDHSSAYTRGFTVEPWPAGQEPAEIFSTRVGGETVALIPETLSGEVWRRKYLFGTAVSSFGLVYNLDRLNDLGIKQVPSHWEDLADPVYFGQVGMADPTKSGSIAKAYEMIVHQQMHEAAKAAGFSDQQIAENERRIEAFAQTKGKGYRRGDVPDDLTSYQAALEQGWLNGMALLQSIGANARYFTDSASKVPIDVSMGDAAIGMAIDFYGRFQAQNSRSPHGRDRMVYATVVGGASMSADPISLLRGAGGGAVGGNADEFRANQIAIRDAARHFIEFTLCEEGQRLWTYKPGTPGGPEKFALRRLPIRRDFYPSTQPAIAVKYQIHQPFTADPLGDASVDPYELAKEFIYYRRWTGDHFGAMRDIVKAMCLDSGEELRAAWKTCNAAKGADRERIRRQMAALPQIQLLNKSTGKLDSVPLNWRTAPDFRRNYEPLDTMREWTAAFRRQYREVANRNG